jgi:hypothetical protein
VVGVCARMASPKTAAVALVNRASPSSPSFPRSGLGAGEVVEVRRAWISVSAPPAGLGGEERSRWRSAFPFGCWWVWWSSSSTFQLRPALVARGAASGGGAGLVVVDLGGAVPAGRWVVAGGGCCGRACSATLGSVLQRRTAPAAIYMLWRHLLPGGKRYGGAAVA